MVVYAACIWIVKTFEDRSAVNHCAQVRLTFNIIDDHKISIVQLSCLEKPRSFCMEIFN